MNKEGKAEIFKEERVFYNPIQQFNRDLSVMAIKAYIELRDEAFEAKQAAKQAKKDNAQNASNPKRRKIQANLPKINVLEGLSATGLRAIRYAHEIPRINKIVANDLLPTAVEMINRNIEYNKVGDIVKANQGDATKFMGGTDQKFHIIDLDPYGTATPFIDGAIQCVEEDGMLLVTCTDAGVLAGAGYPEKCFALYGGNNFGSSFINSETNHEVGIRLMLQLIASTAAKYKKAIEPVLCLSIDYYFRIFVRVKTRPIEVKKLSSRTMISFGCNGCGHKVNQPLGRVKGNKFQYPKLETVSGDCKYCSSYYTVAGPMFLPPLHNQDFIDKVLKINEASDKNVYGTTERIKGMLTLAKHELDTPFYFNLSQLASIFKSNPIPIQEFSRAIGNLGYNISLTHAKKNCVKTDAPWETVLQIQKEWMIQANRKFLESMEGKDDISEKQQAKINALKEDIAHNVNLAEHSVGYKVLQTLKPLESAVINFTDDNEQSQQLQKLRKVKMVRYQENPTKNWGPMSRPTK
ncbi:guanine-N2--methyltransferase [Scheffersomyces xylosifermentans]|uniref:guanine-N2--methyltransferase n=1 Tax=Scheffersomyces xylosifermentans TaxID=1304137 RepID=UPI00315D55F7